MTNEIPRKIIDYRFKNFNKKRNYIKRRFSYYPKSSEVYVFFPGINGDIKSNFFVRRAVLKKHCSFLEYEFSKGDVSFDAFWVLKFFKVVTKLIKKDIDRIKKKYKFRKIHFIGLSLGSISVGILSRSFSNSGKIFLIVPVFCMAESLWKSKLTKGIKEQVVKSGIRLKKLKKLWSFLELRENMKHFKGKLISMLVSKSDELSLYKPVKDNHLKKIIVRESKLLGHYLTAWFFYLFPKRFLD